MVQRRRLSIGPDPPDAVAVQKAAFVIEIGASKAWTTTSGLGPEGPYPAFIQRFQVHNRI
jgi:hypothetical protein